MKKGSTSLLSGSITLLIAYNLFNFCNLLYQVSMARLLSPVEYGMLATAFTVLYVVGVCSEAIQTTVTTYVSQTPNKGKILWIFKKVQRRVRTSVLSIVLLYLLIAWPLAPLLKVPYTLLALTGLVIPLSLYLPIARGVLQGTEQFKKLGLNLVVEAGIKTGGAIILVLLGWSIYGALTGILIGTLCALPLAYVQLRNILKITERPTLLKAPLSQGIITFILMFAIVGFYSLDLLIARIVFSEEVAGNYALAAVIGKIVLWGTIPISKAFLPLAMKSSTEIKKKMLRKAGAYTAFLLGIALLFLYFMPGTIIMLFTGKVLPLVEGAVFNIALAMSTLSFLNLYFMYLLATLGNSSFKDRKIKGLVVAISAGLLSEAVILYSMSETLASFTQGLIFSSLVIAIYTITARQLTK